MADMKKVYDDLIIINLYIFLKNPFPLGSNIELVSKELKEPFCMFMPGVWILWSKKEKFVIIFQNENGNTFTLFIIFILKSLQ